MHNIILTTTHPSWHSTLTRAVEQIPTAYIEFLNTDSIWLPGLSRWLSCFSLPLERVQFVLYGESPYPRHESANGYAFWDTSVSQLWSPTGFSKQVNRATSLRNILKMLLVAEGCLVKNKLNQQDVSIINKENFVSTLSELFNHLINDGFLLLNANLALTSLGKKIDSKAFIPFQAVILETLSQMKPHTKLILLGKIAEEILKLPHANLFDSLVAEHPYNLSFIHNPKIIEFFKPLHLLHKRES
jgi:uracil-DNA glycosylase